MTTIQKVRKVCKWLIFSDYADNDAELAKILGYTKSSFSQILNEKVPLSEKFIDKLCTVDNNINKIWILYDKEDMFKEKKVNDSGKREILKENSTISATADNETVFYKKLLEANEKLANESKELAEARLEIIVLKNEKIATLEQIISELRYITGDNPIIYRTVAEPPPELKKGAITTK